LAQAPPPPPPLIYKAPQKSEFKEFVSDDKTFQVTFPGVPKVTKQEMINASIISYRVYRQGSNSIADTIDFNSNLENNKEKFYEIIKGNLLKMSKSKIEAEKDFQINGKSGKEFDVLYDYQYQKIRILVVGKRVYEIRSDVTNWHIIGDKTKKEFFDETERFFNSFRFLDKK
jgi:hypothetical protein